MSAGAARVGPQRIFDHTQWKPALEYLDRRGSYGAAVRDTLRAVTVSLQSASPAATVKLIVGPEFTRVGMRAAHQQVARGTDRGGAHPIRHRLRHRTLYTGDQSWLPLGVTGDAGCRKTRIDQRSWRRDHLDRAEDAAIERHIVRTDTL